jgi:acetyl esterase/lipase
MTPAPEQRHFRDVPYASRSSRQTADIYLPSSGSGPFPVIVFIHGGGYVSGDKAAIVPGLVSAANRRGFAVVSVGYRLLDEADFPAQIHDVKAAIRWVRASAGAYAFDAGRIAAWGTSAGGHLAALAGTSEGVALLEDPSLGHADEAAGVNAVVDWYGPADFVALRDHLEAERRLSGGGVTFPLDYITQRIDDSPELVEAANPATHADPGDPPIFIRHGDADEVVPAQQSLALAEALVERMGASKVTLEIEPGEGHGTGVFIATDTVAGTLDWIEDALE